MFFQQIEKPRPGCSIHFFIAVLRGVSTRGIQQNGIVSEPPVAVTGSSYAMNGIPAQLVFQWKTQAGIEQCRSLSTTWRSDKDIPGQLIQKLPVVFPTQLGFFQDVYGFIQPLLQDLQFFRRFTGGEITRFSLICLADHGFQHLLVPGARPEVAP